MSHTITAQEVQQAQQQWGDGVVAIANAFQQQQDHQSIAQEMLDTLYAYNYGDGIVLFKPTLATQVPFRKTSDSALSYFIGDNAQFEEDQGFAIRPWEQVIFSNDQMFLHDGLALAMGQYHFIDNTDNTLTAEYTFGYIKDDRAQLKIILHHSSATLNS